MSNNDHMHWKIVDKCSHLTFFCLPSWQIKTAPSMSHTPGTESLLPPDRHRVWFTALSSSFRLSSSAGYPIYLIPAYLTSSHCFLVSIKSFLPI